MNKKPIKRAAVLHDLCCVGKAAMTNILPVLSVMGTEACPIPTMALSTHTGGFGTPAVHHLDTFPLEAADHLKRCGVSFDAVFLGYLGSLAAVERAKAWVKAFPGTEVLLDPIMADHGRFYSNFDEDYCRAMRGLLPLAGIITPNYTESCLLSGEPFTEACDAEKLERICEKLLALGAKKAVITSVPCGPGHIGIAVAEPEKISLLKKDREGRAYPGTGDLFAAVLLGSLLKGRGLYEAAEDAHGFVARCIRESDAAGYDTREGVLLEPQLRYLLERAD